MVFGEYNTYNGLNPMNKTSAILYGSFSRLIWAVSVSFIIYACVTSYGGFVNQILSWPIWIPLSKLSFCAYLIQFTIIYSFVYSQDHLIHAELSNYVRSKLNFCISFYNLFKNILYVLNLRFIYRLVILFSLLALGICVR